MLFRTELREMWRRDRLGSRPAALEAAGPDGLATVVLASPSSPVTGCGELRSPPLIASAYVADLYASTMSGEYLYLLVTKRTLAGGSLMNPWSLSASPAWSWRACGPTRRAGGPGRMPFRRRVLLCHLADLRFLSRCRS